MPPEVSNPRRHAQKPMIAHGGPAPSFRGARGRLCGTVCVVLSTWISLYASTAAAQDEPSGSGWRRPYASTSNPSRKKPYRPVDRAGPVNWSGLSLDLGFFRPINAHVSINNGTTEIGQFNLTGVHFAVGGAYLFQDRNFVVGPRVKLQAGWIEAMPLDYTIRYNAGFTVGGEAGYAVGKWYGYGFATGGAGWMSANRIDGARANNLVPAYDFGFGLRYALPNQWYAKSEVSYTTLGDHRLGVDYMNPKPFFGLTLSFGYRFASN